MRNALALLLELGSPLDVGVLCRFFGIQYMDGCRLPRQLKPYRVYIAYSRLHAPTKHVTSPPITHDLTDGMISLDDKFYYCMELVFCVLQLMHPLLPPT